MTKQLILDLDPNALENKLKELGQPKFRSAQVLEGLYKHHYNSFELFPNLPKTLISKLDDEFLLDPLSLVSSVRSRDKKTEKFLFSLHDGSRIETVLMKYAERNTVCISSQVGCPLGCVFCVDRTNGLYPSISALEKFWVRFCTVCATLKTKVKKTDEYSLYGYGGAFPELYKRTDIS